MEIFKGLHNPQIRAAYMPRGEVITPILITDLSCDVQLGSGLQLVPRA